MWYNVTCYVVIGSVAALAIYDAIARVFGGNHATESAVIQDAAYQWPIIPFLIGLLCGHVFWPVK